MQFFEISHHSDSLCLSLYDLLLLFCENLLLFIYKIMLLKLLVLLNNFCCYLTVNILHIHHYPPHADCRYICDLHHWRWYRCPYYNIPHSFLFKLQLALCGTTILHPCAQCFYLQIITDTCCPLSKRCGRTWKAGETLTFLG